MLRSRAFREYAKLLLSLGLLIPITLVEIYAIQMLRNPLQIALSLAAYLILVPTLTIVSTLWSEIRMSVADILAKPRRERITVFSYVTRSVTLYRVSRGRFLRRLTELLAMVLANRLEKANIVLDPYNTAALCFLTSLSLGIALALLSIYILGLETVLAIVIALAISATAMFAPLLVLDLAISRRRGSIRLELPFFILYASLVEKAGRNLVIAFERIARQTRLFKFMSREALALTKILTFFEAGPLSALKTYASSVPNKELRSIVEDYISIAQTGGDTARFLESETERLIQIHSAEWSSYVERIGLFGDIIVSLFVLLPALIVLGAIAFSQGTSLIILEVFTYFIVPITAIAIYIVVDAMQPRHPSAPLLTTLDKVVIPTSGFLGTVVVGIVSTSLNLDTALAISLAMLIPTLATLSIYMVRSIEISKIERDLPRFLRDVAEALRIGYSFVQAIPKIATGRHYNRFLDRYIAALSVLLQMNIPLKEIQQSVETRSWLFNYSLFILCELETLGALSPKEVEMLAKFIESVEGSRRKARSSLTFYSVLFILAPILVLILAILAQSILTALGTGVAAPLIQTALVKQIIDIVKILAAILALSLGIVGGKIRDGTGINTLYAVIALTIITVTLALWSNITEFIPIALAK